jgi:hypothetical protein
LSVAFLLAACSAAWAAERGGISKGGVAVIYDEPLREAAKDILDEYPSIRSELRNALGWSASLPHTLVLLKDRESFSTVSESDLMVAVAMPHEKLIVLDYKRAASKPFTLRETLKHELCHLVLHENIKRPDTTSGRAPLPRWVDEGVCQWAGGGPGELEALGRETEITRAALFGRLIPLYMLEDDFPLEESALILAYEQSKSVVEYIAASYGNRGVMDMLRNLSEGSDIEEAVYLALDVTLAELEARWHAELKRRHTWLAWLSNNLYTMLFVFASLVLLLGFIRVLWRLRTYRDEDEDGRA